MAKFIYKMQNILNIKYKLEEQAKSFYSEARAELDKQEKILENLTSRKLNYEVELKSNMCSILDLLTIRKLEDAIEMMKYKIRLQMICVEEARKNLEAARLRLNEAMIDRKTHEKLKENAFEEFKLEVNSEEKKEIDELTSFKYSHQTGSEDE